MHSVIHERAIPRLYDFVAYWEGRGINTVYLCFPWYISPETAARMDAYYEQHFAWLRPLDRGAPPSWHSFQYHLPPEALPVARRAGEADH